MLNVDFFILYSILFINAVPSAICLLLGAVRWAITFFIIAVTVSLGIIAVVVAASLAIDLAFEATISRPILRWVQTSAGVLIAIYFEYRVAAFFERMRKRGNSIADLNGPTLEGRNWIVEFHDSIHGIKIR